MYTNILIVDANQHYVDKIIAVVDDLAQQIDSNKILIAGRIIEFCLPIYAQTVDDENSNENSKEA